MLRAVSLLMMDKSENISNKSLVDQVCGRIFAFQWPSSENCFPFLYFNVLRLCNTKGGSMFWKDVVQSPRNTSDTFVYHPSVYGNSKICFFWLIAASRWRVASQLFGLSAVNPREHL